ncbi:hypothetical protein LIER_25183 [Lithospermum erythrorhizon]|uniref:Uncharacterized protein n=1 Tax=Lithospermum erythrorhizon TaxID=34254 RepID=A0AAV3R9N6_LITER
MSSTTSLFVPSFSRTRRSTIVSSRPKRYATTVLAAKREAHDHNHNGRIVDKNMIILRKRIHEMKMVEKSYEPLVEWMDWERKCCAYYDTMICEALGILQSRLMDTRPSLALGLIALMGLSLPVSMMVVLFHMSELYDVVVSLDSTLEGG